MKFRAKLAPEQISLLHTLLIPMTRISSTTGGSGAVGEGLSSSWARNGSILYLDNDHVRISCKGRSNDTDGITCFAELKAGGGIFLEHRIESIADRNQIVLELDLAQLRLALKSICSDKKGSNATSAILEQQQLQPWTVLKLAKRHGIPCLCLDASTTSSRGGLIQVHHAIPVRVLRASEMQHYLPPQVSSPDVQLELSPDKPLRGVVDRMRTMCPRIYLEADTASGELTISMDSEGASIRTYFGKLTPRQDYMSEDGAQPRNAQDRVLRIKVDAKKLLATLHWQQQTALVSSALLCFVENEMLVVHAVLHPSSVGFFTYYCPTLFLSSDPADE